MPPGSPTIALGPAAWRGRSDVQLLWAIVMHRTVNYHTRCLLRVLTMKPAIASGPAMIAGPPRQFADESALRKVNASKDHQRNVHESNEHCSSEDALSSVLHFSHPLLAPRRRCTSIAPGLPTCSWTMLSGSPNPNALGALTPASDRFFSGCGCRASPKLPISSDFGDKKPPSRWGPPNPCSNVIGK